MRSCPNFIFLAKIRLEQREKHFGAQCCNSTESNRTPQKGDKDDIKNDRMTEEQRKLIIAKNRLFGKINLNGIILSYDEKSKRVYGPRDDVNVQFGWDRSDGFEQAGDMEIPF